MADEMPKHGTFCWNELATNDVEAAKKFYASLLGWTTKEMPMQSGVYTIFNTGDKDVGGMYMITEEMGQVPPHWMGYITVDDVDAMVKKTEELGGKVCMAPTDIPEVGRMAVITDPTGATISLMTFFKK